jgi:hypothetical protein
LLANLLAAIAQLSVREAAVIDVTAKNKKKDPGNKRDEQRWRYGGERRSEVLVNSDGGNKVLGY